MTGNLNALLEGERTRIRRYRDTLGNLAHSLKTPLAVMRQALGASDNASKAALDGEIDRMSGIIEHQMKRAAASGGVLLGQAPVDVAPIVSELRVALLKVYGNKDLLFETVIAPGAQFIGDRADLTELLGNLLDNACKWARARVRIEVAIEEGADTRTALRLTSTTTVPASRSRIVPGSCSVAAALMRPRRVMASASPWSTTPWRCTADRCASRVLRWAARDSCSRCQAGWGQPLSAKGVSLAHRIFEGRPLLLGKGAAPYGPSLISNVMP